MIRYWLTPIYRVEPFTLGDERVLLSPLDEIKKFRQILHNLHPWLLPLFKTDLLMGNEEEVGMCRLDEMNIDLSQKGDIQFMGDDMLLSHCAEAFIERLLRPLEAASYLQLMDLNILSEYQRLWFSKLTLWYGQQYRVILLKEDL